MRRSPFSRSQRSTIVLGIMTIVLLLVIRVQQVDEPGGFAIGEEGIR